MADVMQSTASCELALTHRASLEGDARLRQSTRSELSDGETQAALVVTVALARQEKQSEFLHCLQRSLGVHEGVVVDDVLLPAAHVAHHEEAAG